MDPVWDEALDVAEEWDELEDGAVDGLLDVADGLVVAGAGVDAGADVDGLDTGAAGAEGDPWIPPNLSTPDALTIPKVSS